MPKQILESPIICPYCTERTNLVNISDGVSRCPTCGKILKKESIQSGLFHKRINSMRKLDWFIIILTATCLLFEFHLIMTLVEKVPNFDGYRACLTEKKSNCDTKFAEVPAFLKKYNLNLGRISK